MIDEKLLHRCWLDLNKRAASGVDGVTAAEYGENLTERIEDLVQRLRTKRYRTKVQVVGSVWAVLLGVNLQSGHLQK